MQVTPSEATARGECGRAGAAHDLGDPIVVDPVPGDVAQQQRFPLSGEALRWRVPPAEPLAPRDAPPLKLEKPVEIRLRLQRQAPANLRHHVWRAVTRLAVLVLADLATFALLRGLIRAGRDGVVFGEGLAQEIQTVLPAGYLNGWQLAAALLLGLLVTGNYGQGDRRRDPARLFAACTLAAALPLWSALWTRGPGVVFVQFSLTAVLIWVAIVAERLTIDRIKAWVRPPERDALDTLFVGPAGACVTAMNSPAFSVGTEYLPIGFVDTQAAPAPGAVGHLSDFSVLLAASGARAVVVCGYLSQAQFQEVVDTALAAGCQVLSVPRTVEIAGVHPNTVWRRGQPLVELTAPSLKGWQLFVKRLLDLVVSSAGLLLLAPLLALVGIAIKLESRGAMIFGHGRLGANGRQFKCYKFRSMHEGADQRLRSDPELYATYVANGYKVPQDQDPRLTRVGRFLRKTSLDEFPQLINVLKGEMSLVGPRPIVPDELDHYAHDAALFLSLKPGMTGAWAVNGRSGLGYPDRADIELEYIRCWSIWRDIRVLFQTIPVVVRGRGSF